jgi:hypothetical protein
MFTSLTLVDLLSLGLVVGMALSLENVNAVMQKVRMEARKPGVAEAIRSLKAHLQQLSNPDLQLVPITGLRSADLVVADVACKLYAVFLQKPAASTTNAWFKGSNHASTAAANGELVIFLQGTGGGGRQYCPVFHDGLLFGTGLTVAAHTTNNGNTDSNIADAPTGFAIIGAP